MIRKIRELLTPKKFHGTPYNLTKEEVSNLKSLRSYEEWKFFQSSLDKIVTLLAEELLVSSEFGQMRYLSGKIHGLQQAGTLIDEIIILEEHSLAERRKRTESDAERGRLRQLGGFASRAWNL